MIDDDTRDYIKVFSSKNNRNRRRQISKCTKMAIAKLSGVSVKLMNENCILIK